MDEWIRLSPAELFLLWWAMDLGEPPPVLGLPRPGSTPEHRAAHLAEASEALRARGLGTTHQPAPPLAAALQVLSASKTTLDLHAYSSDGPHHGFGAVRGHEAAVAVRDSESIRLANVTPDGLAAALFGLVAPMRAAPSLPASVTVDDYTAACRAGEVAGAPGFVRVLRAAGLREPDIATVARAVTTRTGGGQLGATNGGRRLPAPVTWVDTPTGRYAMRRHDEWVTITPANRSRLATMTDDMLRRSADPTGTHDHNGTHRRRVGC